MPKGVYDRHKNHDGLCTHCKVNPSKYSIGTSTATWCNECSKAYERERYKSIPYSKKREKALKSKFGITFAEFVKMFEAQEGSCAICFSEFNYKDACVDHCHTTNKIRGLLCNHCNRALGLVKEKLTVIARMSEYIKENRID